VNFRSKIIAPDQFLSWRLALRQLNQRLVVTNGCFDIFHVGHATYLEAARKQGDALLVGVNGDAGVRDLKGPGRPINNEEDRASVIAALESVSGVFVFPETRATNFLRLAEPDIYVKGGDYTVETIPQEERKVVENAGGKIVFLSFVPGKSSSGLIEKISQL
jgi:rfaE bifunctional protein nucleotidyltransferase chain/domain